MKFLPSMDFVIKFVVTLAIVALIARVVGVWQWVFDPYGAYQSRSGTTTTG